jgi:2-phosphoglycerate kinase
MMGSVGEATGDGTVAVGRRLRHVYWIGGGSGAGKSTIARRIAADHGFRFYSTDAVMAEHATRCAPEDCPFLSQFRTMDMDERWLNRSPELMLETFHWFRGECFGPIVEDLLRLPDEPPVIAEGFRLLPPLVQPLMTAPHQAVWLLPTPGFRRAAFASRAALWEIAGKTSNPERALLNLLDRDRMFTERLREQTRRLQLPVIDVDITLTEDHLTEIVATSLGL